MRIGPGYSGAYRSLLMILAVYLGCFFLAACHGGGGGVSVSVAVSPATASVVTGTSIPLSAKVSGTTNWSITWTVNGVAGGNSTVGTINTVGVYTAPSSVPTPSSVQITATSVADTTKSATATITVLPLSLAGPGGGYFGNFTTAGTMISARANHTANLLANGKVLIAGGLGSGGVAIAAAELYSPAFGTYSTAGVMATPRAYHTATLMTNGKVLIAGGVDNSNTPLASAELFDPDTGKFTSTGSMATARAFHTATLLTNGKVLISGGNANGDLAAGSPLSSAEIYDPVTGLFTHAAALTVARYYHTASMLPNGKVLLAGGIGVGGAKLPDAELYDPGTDTFTATGSMLVDATLDTGRWLHSATLLGNGTVLTAGGDMGTHAALTGYLNTGQLYAPAAGTYSDIIRFLDAPTNTVVDPASVFADPRGAHSAATRADGLVLFDGGIGGNTPGGATFLASAELYHPAGTNFSATGSMHAARANHTSTILPNGKILVLGGNNAGAFLSSAELYQ